MDFIAKRTTCDQKPGPGGGLIDPLGLKIKNARMLKI